MTAQPNPHLDDAMRKLEERSQAPPSPVPAPTRIEAPQGIQLTSTHVAGRLAQLNFLVHGPSGAGKTWLARTAGAPSETLVIAAEPGLLTLRDVEIPVVVAADWPTLQRVYSWLRSGRHPFKWVVLDSISEIAERCLSEEKKSSKDGRRAYGEMGDRMDELIRAWRDLPLHVVMIAKQERTQDDQGRLLYGPSLPGRKLSQTIGYLFDEVAALRVVEGEPDPAMGRPSINRWLQTGPDGTHEAKDRSGVLDLFEPPDLNAIAEKILGTTKEQQQ